MKQTQTAEKQGISSQRLLAALDEAVTKLEAVERSKTEPIAIIGMSCRFPGEAIDPESFWQVLENGVDAITEVPSERWDIEAYYDPDPDALGKMYTRYGGFLSNVDQFDAAFFGISPREALSLDPQQRLVLEVGWEAIERAGLPHDTLAGSPAGVFIGITTNDYGHLLSRRLNSTQIDPYFGTGNALNATAGRLAYTLGLQGPGMVIDTACSSSLVALHLACLSLRTGECVLALAGGVNLILTPEILINLSRSRMLAPDGRCKTFDQTANGYVRGEGCGILVLKRLSQALQDRDHILALIRGSAVNQDGASGGLTVPNGSAQQALIRQALAHAKLEPASVDYLEAHGTGTSLGDPIEVNAAASVLCAGREPTHPLIVGSVKTNIGHLESAAGIAGIIKVVLAFQHQKIPPHLHFRQPNAHIPWRQYPLIVPTEGIPWLSGQKPRIAGVSAFGVTGTNAHVLLEEAPGDHRLTLAPGHSGRQHPISSSQPAVERPLHLLTLSAKTENALQRVIQQYHKHINEHPDVTLPDVCFSANTERTHFPRRLSVVAAVREQMSEKLAALMANQQSSGGVQGTVRNAKAPKVAFLFTGQGSQYPGMGRELYDTQPTFRHALDRCNDILSSYLDIPLLKILYPDHSQSQISNLKSQIHLTAYAQPTLFALEYALAKLWQSWGICPSAMMGHSVGEYAAACVAGVFSLEDGLKLIAERGRLMQALPAGGEMVVLLSGKDQIADIIRPYAADISIAALNGPRNTVISGTSQAIQAVVTMLQAEGINSKRLTVSHAFHSPLMDPMLEEFKRTASELTYTPPKIAFYSNLRGDKVSTEIATPDYWIRHVRQPVQFQAGMQALDQNGYDIFVEIGPGTTLLGMGRQVIDNSLWLPSLRANRSDWQQMLESLGELYVKGVHVDWNGFDRDYARSRVMLPTYPFQRQRYWPPESNSQPLSTQDEVITLLRHAHQEDLLKQLDLSGEFAEEEKRLLPRILEVLLRQSREQDLADTVKEWFYTITWRSQEHQGPTQPPDYLPEVDTICRPLAVGLDDLKTQYDLEQYQEVLAKLEHVSVEFVVNAFREMGWEFQRAQRFSTAALQSQFGVIDQHQRLFSRLLEILEEAAVIARRNGQWEVVSPPAPQDLKALMHELLAQYPAAGAEIEMLERCGAGIAGVLQGTRDPLQLLFPEGNVTTAARLYQDTPGAKAMNSLVQQIVSAVLNSLPQGRRLRILEVGAGTGGTTGYILPLLPVGQTDYVFTDISPAFLTQARGKFQSYPFVRYQRFDIERAPDTQGFEGHQFDLILAANVVHATRDLRQTLHHLRQLVQPNGMLVLLEGVAKLRFIDLIYGLTEGWWRFTDQQLRPDHPLISTSQWRALLREIGFQQAATLSFPEEEGHILSKQAVIVAQTPAAEQEVPARASRHWLIFADARGIGQQLGAALESRGNTYTLVFPGATYKRSAERVFHIHPETPEDVRRLLTEIQAEALHGIVHLWSLDAKRAESLTADEVQISSQRICGSALHVVQAVIKAQWTQIPALYLVTQGAVAAGAPTHVPGVVQAPLWGMGRVIGVEHPELKPVLIDLDPHGSEEQVQALCDEVESETPENQVAFRNHRRYVARLVRYPENDAQFSRQPLTIREDAAYLIIGGLGGLGLLVAEWLGSQGARHLVLAGRSGAATETARTHVKQLQDSGISITVVQADVSQQEQVARMLSEIRQSYPPLQGIIHAAGVLDDGVLQQLTSQRFAKVMAPKVEGAWNLHALTLDLPLDFFLLFSTATAFLGTPGQANHAAANTFLDSLAYYRQQLGLPGLSINWGAWADVGAASTRTIADRIKMKGIGTIAPQHGLRTLEYAWSQHAAQIAIIPIDWSQCAAATADKPFFSECAQPAEVSLSEQQSEFLKQIKAASGSKRPALLTTHVRSQVARVLGLNPTEPIDVQQGFFELGMDSLTSVELRNRLQESLKTPLPSTLAFDYPTVAELVAYLLREVPLFAPSASARDSFSPEQADEAAALTDLEQLSDDEIGALLDEQLADIEQRNR